MPLDLQGDREAWPVADQSTLHGILTRIRDLNLTLVTVESFEGEHDGPTGLP
jgi:hypothetical protein